MYDIGTDRSAIAGAAAAAGWRDFVALLKPRVMSLVVFTGLVGLLAAPADLHPVLALTAILSLAVGAGAAGAINMWYDADIDACMTRTAGRPVPAGRVAPGEALGFALVLAVGAVAMMGLNVNWLAAAILAFSIFFYGVVYTMGLKRRTPQNIVIGGAAGAFPPVIGWVAATGEVGLMPLILFAIIFLWTPPHFWALALVTSADYARAGIPMLPVVAGRAATRRQIVVYSLLLVAVSLAPWLLGLAGALYGMSAVALGALFLHGAVALARRDTAAHARRLFGFSILYLFALFTAVAVDAALAAGS
ncbi:MAG: protoheme IX farnesyltransferase [Alphaproteobacteria bacterium]|nr:MAG: protoheme IX farnesyltransferase [Alphaproteobacteria bacterium]